LILPASVHVAGGNASLFDNVTEGTSRKSEAVTDALVGPLTVFGTRGLVRTLIHLPNPLAEMGYCVARVL